MKETGTRSGYPSVRKRRLRLVINQSMKERGARTGCPPVHGGGPRSEEKAGLSSDWSLTRLGSYQAGLSSSWSLMRLVSHQAGFLYGWSLIRVSL